jgi:hypothetical protein
MAHDKVSNSGSDELAHECDELAKDTCADSGSAKTWEASAPRQLGGQTFATSGDQCCDVQVAEATDASGATVMRFVGPPNSNFRSCNRIQIRPGPRAAADKLRLSHRYAF